MNETLEDVLSDARQKIPVFKKGGGFAVAEVLEEFVTRVSQTTHDYRTFVSEKEAIIRSGKSLAWLRDRFPEWKRQGNAEKEGRARRYRLLILPVAARISSAQADAVETARGE